jgi:hypothetical protein
MGKDYPPPRVAEGGPLPLVTRPVFHHNRRWTDDR